MLLVPLRALAQEEAPPPPPQRTPPVLTEFIAAPAPAGLEDRSAAVVLEITVEVDGTVSDVQVAEAAGEGFDEAALEAARRFVFEPARRDGVAVRARIRYRYLFEPVVVTTTVTEEVPDETLEEETSEEEEGGSEEASLEETEGSEETERDPEEEGEGEGEGDETELGVEAVVYAPPRDGLRRTLEREVLTTIPGTRGDALRVVELLPGVGRPAFGGGVVLVRGAAPGDSEVYLDGVPVPLLYHFGGLTSFYNSQLLDRIDFVPGNFSVRYGRRIGGILEVTPRDPRTDEYHGFVDINLIDASLMIEGPIGEHFAFAVAARRSWIDLILGEVLPANGPNFLAAPVYYDYQLMLTYRPDASHRFRLIVYGSSDQLALLFNGPGGNDPNVRGNFGISTQFHRAQLSWLLLHEDWFEQEITVAFGGTLLDIAIGESTRLDADFLPLQIRSEWRAQIAETSRIVGGLDIQITPLTLSFLGGQPTQSEGMPAMPGGSRVAFDSGNVTAYRPGAYIESQNTLFDRLDMVVGVRADWYREIQSWSIDPRLTTRLRVIPEVSVRAAVGLFSQPPEFQNTTPGIGNPELAPTRAIHVGLGADLELEEYRPSPQPRWLLQAHPRSGGGDLGRSAALLHQRWPRTHLRPRGGRPGEPRRSEPGLRLPLVHPDAQRATRRPRSALAALRLRSDAHPLARAGVEHRRWLAGRRDVPLGERQPLHPGGGCGERSERGHLSAPLRAHELRPEPLLPPARRPHREALRHRRLRLPHDLHRRAERLQRHEPRGRDLLVRLLGVERHPWSSHHPLAGDPR